MSDNPVPASTTPPDLMTPYERFLLALCVWREASGEGAAGMAAVAHVILNRVRAGWGDLVGVITARNQFTSMSHAGDPGTVRWPGRDDPPFATALAVVGALVTAPDPTGGALYYARLDQIDPGGWFERHILDVHPKTAVIGHHSFFA